MLNRINTHFSASIEAKVQAAESLAPLIAQATEVLVCCLVNDKKILTCGSGSNACNAQYFTTQLINQFTSERPGLPAISLNSDGASLSSIAHNCGYHDVFSKQIRALGQPEDVLLILSDGNSALNTTQAVQAAHDREMTIIAVTGQDGGDLARLLGSEDIEIRIPSEQTTRIFEVQTLVIHCLCDLIDEHLFGISSQN